MDNLEKLFAVISQVQLCTLGVAKILWDTQAVISKFERLLLGMVWIVAIQF